MGQIIGAAAKPIRCNYQSLADVGTPDAGQYVLVSSDNSMQSDGQGNFDTYLIGDGSSLASALTPHKISDEPCVSVNSLDAEFSILSRHRRADTLAWTSGSGLNMVRVSIPDGTEKVRIVMTNSSITMTGGYLAYYFSTSAYAGNENMIEENYFGVESGEACNIDVIVEVPSTAVFLYLCTTESGTVNDTLTTNLAVYAAEEITDFVADNRTSITSHEATLRELNYESLDVTIVNVNRGWRSDTLAWATMGGYLNAAQVTLPTDYTGSLYLKISNPQIPISYTGYLAFWFSESSSANDSYISDAGEISVGKYETCDIEEYLTVPDGAAYLYVATSQGSAVGDIITTNVSVMTEKEDEITDLQTRTTTLETEVAEIQESGVPIEAEVRLPLQTMIGYYVSSDDGSLVEGSSNRYAIVDIEGLGYKYIRFMSSVYSGNYGYGFFLSDNSWVGTRGTTTTSNTYITVEVPEDAVEFRACWSTNYVTETNWMYATIEQTTKEYVDAQADERKFFPLHFSYDMSVITEPSIIGFSSHSLSDFYALYDGLVSSYPDYITKVDCSDADSEITAEHPDYLTDDLPIYLYKFCPNHMANYNEESTNEFLNIMIVTGTHSNEKMGMYVVYYMMKKICEEWKTNEDLSQLRKMVNFYIIPCLNPWGFENASATVDGIAIPGRQNGNGVNLNRNFPTANWYLDGESTDSDGNYSGASAGSEYETQICMYYANLYDIDVFHDAHTGNMNAYGAFGVIECYDGEDMANMTMTTARSTTTALINLDSNFPDDGDQRLIDVNVVTQFGEAHRWAYENITPYSWLSEQSVESKFSNGTLTSSVVESQSTSALIWQMNLVAQYNLLLRQIDFALRTN